MRVPRKAAGRPPKVKPEGGPRETYLIENAKFAESLHQEGREKVPFDSQNSIYYWMMVEQLCGDDLWRSTLLTPTAVTSRLHVCAGLRPCLKLAFADLHKFVTFTAGHRPCFMFTDANPSGFVSAGHRPCLKFAFKDVTVFM